MPIKDEITPRINIIFRPYFPIKSETGINKSANVRNCKERGNVAYSFSGDNKKPTSPVLIIPILVVVTDKPWAIAKINTFFFAKSN